MGAVFVFLILSLIVAYGDARILRRQKRSTGASFNYDLCDNTGSEYGPPFWFHVAAGCGTSPSGKPQSPINIATPNLGCTEEHTMAYDDDAFVVKGSVLNNGHTALFEAETTTGSSSGLKILQEVPELANAEYTFAEFHFHIGSNDADDACKDHKVSISGGHGGSEHSIDGKFRDGEFHLVHVLKKDDDSSSQETIGLVALGILFQVAGPGDTVNTEAETIIQTHVANVQTTSSSPITGVTFNPSNILPDNKDVYTYAGTTTTPPCRDDIRFVIFKNPIYISFSSYNILQATQTKVNRNIENISSYGNRRPIQSTIGLDVEIKCYNEED